MRLGVLIAIVLLTACTPPSPPAAVGLAEPPRHERSEWTKLDVHVTGLDDGAAIAASASGRLVLATSSELALSDDDGQTWAVANVLEDVRYTIKGEAPFLTHDAITDGTVAHAPIEPRLAVRRATFVDASTLITISEGRYATSLAVVDLSGSRPATRRTFLSKHGSRWTAGYRGPDARAFAGPHRPLVGGSIDSCPVVYELRDLGEWEPLLRGEKNAPGVVALHFATPDVGWFLFADGTLEHTRDGGRTFQVAGIVPRDIVTAARDLAFFPNGTGFLVGEGGLIARTTDGGGTFKRIDSLVNATLNAVRLDGEASVWIVGDAGTVLRSVDEGRTWSTHPLPAGTALRDLAVSKGRAWIPAAGALYVSRASESSPPMPLAVNSPPATPATF